MNVNDFEAMQDILTEKGYKMIDGVIDTPVSKIALYVSTTDEPNVILFMHKK